LTPEFLYEAKELRAHIIKAIRSLPKRRRSVLLLHMQGMNLEEIAAFLGETRAAVRHLLYRGIEGLRDTVSFAFADQVKSPRRRGQRQTEGSPEG
jgi:RNA polymerase sigma factor (sigma-70 family)